MTLPYKALLVGTAVLAGSAYWYWGRDAQRSDALNYQTERVSMGRIESLVNTAGTINPVVTVKVGSELSGLVSELHADFNSEVKSGEVIARIDDRTIRARLRQIEADVASARASAEQQQAGLTRARADLELATSEINRQRELIARQLVSQADVDRAEANLKISAAQLEVAKAQVTAAQATILQRQAQLEQTQLDLERTYIRSPVDGTVIDRQVDIGQTVAASLSAPTLFVIAQDLAEMQIEADVDEADIGQINAQQTARFTVDAFADRTFEGHVTQVRKAATVTSNVVTYKVIIGAANPRHQLLPGMTANVNIVLGEKDNVLRVNNSALRFNPPGVDAAQGAAGFGAGVGDRVSALAAELDLNAEQRKAVEAALQGMQAAAAEMRDSFQGGPGFGGPPGNPRERIAQVRQRMINQLNGVLSADQLAKVEQSLGGQGGGFGGPGGAGAAVGSGGQGGPGGRGGAVPGMRPGRIWVLQNGTPKSVRVLVGLADSQYTEVVSSDLKVGDEVIVRLAR
jgi:HlyD family secretion protein